MAGRGWCSGVNIVAVSLLCCTFVLAGRASAATEVTSTTNYLENTQECADKLDKLWSTYYGTTAAGQKCEATLKTAMSVNSVADLPKCPSTNETIACFQMAEDPWYAYIVRCEILKYNVPCGAATGEGAGSSSACQANAAEGGPAADPNFKPGCFPLFRTAHDFHEWLDGDLKLTANAATIIGRCCGWILGAAALLCFAMSA